MLIGKSRLVGECVDNLDPDLTASAVRPGGCDRVADAAVHQPARTALVKPLVPGGKQLAGRGQGGVEFLTVLHSFLIGEAVVVTGEEDLTWRKAFANVQRISNTPDTTAAVGGYLSERAPHLLDVPRNKIHRNVRSLVSGRRIGLLGGLADYRDS